MTTSRGIAMTASPKPKAERVRVERKSMATIRSWEVMNSKEGSLF
jgi:hypothetical protein